MYAIVRTGGKQYRVERGQRLLIERLAAKEGAEVSLEPLLYRSEEAVLDRAGLAQVKVTAKVIEHVRGEKLRVFKFKPKRGYRRRTGHRQELTRIEVTDISQQRRRSGADAAAQAPAKEKARAKPVGAATRPKAAPGQPKAKPARAGKAKADGPKAAKAPGEGKAKAQSEIKAKPPEEGKAKAPEEGKAKARGDGKAAKPARASKAKED
jgi:large subunit ribosomal protein L21